MDGQVDMAKVQKFHQSRRMFAYVKRTLMIAPKDTPLCHLLWLEELGIQEEKVTQIIKHEVRGFVREGNVYLYTGNFKEPNMAMDKAEQIVPLLARVLSLKPEGSVYAGMKIGEEGEMWRPLKNLGHIRIYGTDEQSPTGKHP